MTRTSVRSATDWGQFGAMELALLRRTAPIGAGLPAGAEVTGRGYRRPPVLPLLAANAIDRVSHWRNALPILWPQALDDWGPADTLAVVLPTQGGYVLAQTALPLSFRVGPQQQLEIMRYRLDLFAVAPNTLRPYGSGLYGLSFYGTYPAAGQVFGLTATVSPAWAQQANSCAPWAAAPAIVSGGCA